MGVENRNESCWVLTDRAFPFIRYGENVRDSFIIAICSLQAQIRPNGSLESGQLVAKSLWVHYKPISIAAIHPHPTLA